MTAVDAALRPATDSVTEARLGAELGLLLAAARTVSQSEVDSGAALSSLANTAHAADASADGGKGGESAATLVRRASLAGLADFEHAAPPPRGARAWLRARAAVAAGWATAAAELTITAAYKTLVERAPPASAPVRAFGALAKGGLLHPGLLNFYAETTDHVRRLTSYAANRKFAHPTAGPLEAMAPAPDGGLASVISHARSRHGVRHVLAWHALYGYWAGVAPESEEMAAAKPVMVAPNPSPGVLDVDPCYAWSPQMLSGVGLATDPAALFAGLHGALAAAGVDGVKVDAQATLGMIGAGDPHSGGGPALAAKYHEALEASVAAVFPRGNAFVNCMCHTTEALYSFSHSSLVRSSDDFWPRDPASHTAHVAVNAVNSLFLSPLAIPDWDMFHSSHPAALLHAVARAVSGGPVYVSDAPGKHDAALLRRLVLPDGRVLRAQAPGRPSAGCLFADVMRDGRTLLTVGAVNAGGTGVAAAFNTQGSAWSRRTRRFELHKAPPEALTGLLTPGDVPGLGASPTGAWALWSDAARAATLVDPADPASPAGVPLALARGECDIVAVAPVFEVGGGGGGGKALPARAAALGAPLMLNAGGAIRSAAVDDRGRLCLSVRGAGAVAVWADAAPTAATADGAPLPCAYDAAAGIATLTLPPRARGDGGVEPDAGVVVEW